MDTDTDRAPAGAPVLYTVPETCDMLRVSRTTLYRLTKAGRLYSVAVGKRVLYPREAVTAYLAGERFDPKAGAPVTHADVSTWPPTPSLWATPDDGAPA